jgi:hypothetical protein
VLLTYRTFYLGSQGEKEYGVDLLLFASLHLFGGGRNKQGIHLSASHQLQTLTTQSHHPPDSLRNKYMGKPFAASGLCPG